jgi:hypothetical protein
MSEAKEKILRQQPFSGLRSSVVRPDPAEVETALHECEISGVNDRDSGRVAAYAWYCGVDNDRVLAAIRTAGARKVLLHELSTHERRGERNDADLIALLMLRGSHSQLAQNLGDPGLGWAVAVISAVEVADFGALISSLDSPEDALRLISLYLLVTIVPAEARLSLTKKLMGISDKFFQDILIALVCRWLEDAVAFEGNPIETILAEIEASFACRVVVIGAMFDHVLRRFGSARLPEVQQARLNNVWESINSAGKRVIQHSADIDTILRQAGSRDLDVLAAMSEWRNDSEMAPAAASYIGKRAGEFLRRSFKSAMYDLEGEGSDTRFSERMINPLIKALRFDGIEVGLFRELHERLASDAFSRMTRYATWLNDRKRAVALIVIAGMVANERSDQTLLSAVAQASSELLSQPDGFQTLLKPEEAKRVATILGFQIPAA